MKIQKRLIAEFEEQSYTQIIFPHTKTDWAEYLNEAEETFVNIINAIRKYQECKIICFNIGEVKKHFTDTHNLIFIEYKTDDTWARDCSALSIEENGNKKLLDFTFNAWGNKFDAKKDNAMTKAITPNALLCDFVLEGGAVESNGLDMILTTSACMLNKNRNPSLNAGQITNRLQKYFGVSKILYLKHGYLAGDDTDSHIDTLARFIDTKTIVYVQCLDKKDEHFKELSLMEKELELFAKQYDLRLFALPMCEKIYFKKQRLPATYANFLFVNNAILLPTYSVKTDILAIQLFQDIFPTKKIVPIDCSILIRQHGSLHCLTMNF
ncbi:MAG: agmatine deiminase family protein [Sulfurimonas sp.]